jgi:DivIVA domain-containing protein
MELTPQALHDVEFREARRGGYNTRDVDDFLERVAVGISQLQDRLREAYHRAEAAEGRLADMQRQLDDVQRRGAPVPPPEVGAGVTAGAAGPGEADETLRRTLVLAQRTADATINEAREEASRVLTEARDEAARVRAEAETEAMRDAQAEVDHLLEAREALLHDVDMLERHVDEQRNRVRGGVDELQRLLDDPNAFRASPAPQVTDVSRRPESPPVDVPRPELPPRESREPRPQPQPLVEPSTNGGGFVPKGGQVTIPAPPLDPPAPVGPPPPANGQVDHDRVPPSNAGSLNDGAMVAALQELHGSSPSREPLPSRDDVPREPSGPGLVPGQEPFDALPSLPARGEAPPPPAPEPFDAVRPSAGAGPAHEPFESLPGLPSRNDPFDPLPGLPSRGEAGPSHEPFEPLPGLPSRGDAGAGPAREPFESLPGLPSRGDAGAGPAHEPFESLPGLPSRGDAGPAHEPFDALPGLPARGEIPPPPAPEPFDAVRPSLPSRGDVGGGAGPAHEPFESLPSLPSRGDAGAPHEPLPSRDSTPGREPLLARNAGQPEPLNFPPPKPGTTGFLPDLNAAFNPPPPPPDDIAQSPAAAGLGPVDDLAPIDAPPPPPPPPGFEHLQEVGGIPIEPGSRPSEWGRGVFDNEEELDGQARFGRRR